LTGFVGGRQAPTTGTSSTCPLCADQQGGAVLSQQQRRYAGANGRSYIAFFKHAQFNAPVVPPFATTDGVHFDRQPLPEEKEALVAYLRKL
jgi:hypothetical protein